MQREINVKSLANYLNVSQNSLLEILQELSNEKKVIIIFENKNNSFLFFTEKEIEGISSRLNVLKFSSSDLPTLISEIIPEIQLTESHCDTLLQLLLKTNLIKGFQTKECFVSLNYLLEFLLQLFWNEGKISIKNIAKSIKVTENCITESLAHLQSSNKIQGFYIKNNEEFISNNLVKVEILKMIEEVPGITIPLIANKLGLEEAMIEKIFDELIYDGSLLMRQSIAGNEVEYVTQNRVREEITRSLSTVHKVSLNDIAERLRIQYQVIHDMFSQLLSLGKIKGYIDAYTGEFVAETAALEAEQPLESPSDAILAIENLTVQAKEKMILDKVSIALEPKGILGILGESGTGKSTFLKAIIGQIEVKSGTILIYSHPPHDPEISNIIGYVPQDLSKIYPNFTCLENMEHFGKQYGLSSKEIKQRSEKIFAELKILDLKDTPVAHLSGGQRRRASIAIAMIHQPKILFLDEPTSGLDPVLRKELWNMLSNLNEEYGTSLVVVTHYPEEGEFCSKICMFAKNKGIVAVGNPKRLIKSLPGAGRVIILELKKPFSKISELLSERKGFEYLLEERKNEKFRIFSNEPMRAIVQEITSQIKMTDIQNISQGEANLTDFFRIKLLS